MTKAEKIRRLDDGSLTPQQIADVVGCLPEYVYAVRQRRDGRSRADLRYLKKRESDPDFRRRINAFQREYYHRRKAAQSAGIKL